MATSTTTWAAISENMADTIDSVTPLTLEGRPYRRTRSMVADFRAYADDNGQSVFREFDIMLEALEYEGINDRVVVRRRALGEIVMAYPHTWALYRNKEQDRLVTRASMEAVMEEDGHLISKSVGTAGGANNVAGQFGYPDISHDIEHDDDVSFLVIPFDIQFYYDATLG